MMKLSTHTIQIYVDRYTGIVDAIDFIQRSPKYKHKSYTDPTSVSIVRLRSLLNRNKRKYKQHSVEYFQHFCTVNFHYNKRP